MPCRHAITIARTDIKDALADELGRSPTRKEMSAFKDYLDLDIGQWLKDNARSFRRDKT